MRFGTKVTVFYLTPTDPILYPVNDPNESMPIGHTIVDFFKLPFPLKATLTPDKFIF
jgi:hypothetical protein